MVDVSDIWDDDQDDDEIRRMSLRHGGRRYGRTEWERRNLAPPPVTIATLTAERDRDAAALDEIAGLKPEHVLEPEFALRWAQDRARKAREGTGQ